MTDSYYQRGYESGYADGSAGKPSSQAFPYHILDFVNTETQQEYEDGYESGYEDGKAHREKTQGEEG